LFCVLAAFLVIGDAVFPGLLQFGFGHEKSSLFLDLGDILRKSKIIEGGLSYKFGKKSRWVKFDAYIMLPCEGYG